jgi:hypothetical protein
MGAHAPHDPAVEILVEKILNRAHAGVGDWRFVVNRWQAAQEISMTPFYLLLELLHFAAPMLEVRIDLVPVLR